MGPDGVWRRIRWDNVARLAAIVALGLVVALWPRLGGRGPRLPPATAVPVGVPPGSSKGAVGRETGAARERRARAEKRAAAERRARAEKRAARERRARAERRAVAERRATRERRAEAERRVRDGRQPQAPQPKAPGAPQAAPQRRPRPKRRAPPADPAVAEFGLP
jgi:hypothetical protein